MSGEIEIVMHQELAQELKRLSDMLKAWDKSCLDQIIKALKVIGTRWQSEAKKRVPVDYGTLRQRILTETYKETGGDWTTAVGTNVPYGKWLEFGTKHIAGGHVLALGQGIDVTDAQAIKIWPAKNFGSGTLKKDGWRSRGGFINEKTGVANARAVEAQNKNYALGNTGEEMPWLRTSFNAVKSWAVEMLKEAMLPPSERGKKAG